MTKIKNRKKCKCCNITLGEEKLLIYSSAGRVKNIELLLADCMGKVVKESDGQDQAICGMCLIQLEQMYAFRQKCLTDNKTNDCSSSSTSTSSCSSSSSSTSSGDDENLITEDNGKSKNADDLSIHLNFENETFLNGSDEMAHCIEEDDGGGDGSDDDDNNGNNDADNDDYITVMQSETEIIPNDTELFSLPILVDESPSSFAEKQSECSIVIPNDLLQKNEIKFEENNIEIYKSSDINPDDYDNDEIIEEHIDETVENEEKTIEEIVNNVNNKDDISLYQNIFVANFVDGISAQILLQLLRVDIPTHNINLMVPLSKSFASGGSITTGGSNELDTLLIESNHPDIDDDHDDDTSFDVEKIATSDDLIKILEDDYRSGGGGSGGGTVSNRRRQNSYQKRLVDDDEFKIPKMNVDEEINETNNAQHLLLDENTVSQLIDVDEYVNSVISASFNEQTKFLRPIICSICQCRLRSYVDIFVHTLNQHCKRLGDSASQNDDTVECCLGGPEPCGNVQENINLMKTHWFAMHGDVLRPTIFLTCQTCQMVFESIIKFGKHICMLTTMAEPLPSNRNYKCDHCSKQLISRKRYFFHQQFHMENARPKVCIICEMVFESENKFYEHVTFSHEKFPEYFCSYCDKSYTIQNEWRRHEKGHTAARNFVCTDCGKSFLDQQQLSDHCVLHLPERPLKCDICDKTFARKTRLRKHMLSHRVNRPGNFPTCKHCNQIFETDEKALKHYQQVHYITLSLTSTAAAPSPQSFVCDENFEYKYFESVLCCEFCDATYEHPMELLEHKTTHINEKKYECNYCDSRFDQFSKLKTHLNIHSDVRTVFPIERRFLCDVDGTNCMRTFTEWRNLQCHRKNVHLINPSIFKCDQCDQTFYQSWTFGYHKKSVHGIRHKCPFCAQTFVLERSLQMHVSRVHVNDVGLAKTTGSAGSSKSGHGGGGGGGGRGSKRAKILPESNNINIISNTSKSMNSTVLEQPSVEDIKPTATINFELYLCQGIKIGTFFCRTCGKTFPNRSQAIVHVSMVHLKIVKYRCEVCQKGFYQKGDYNDHMRKHTEETPFKCPQCDYSVRKMSMLTVHIRTHSDERPYKCDICPRAFRRLYVLKMHKKQHTGIRDHFCTICGKAYTTNASVNLHMKKIHNIMESWEIDYLVLNENTATETNCDDNAIVNGDTVPDQAEIMYIGQNEEEEATDTEFIDFTME